MITATRNDKRSKSLNLPQRSRISSQEPKSSNDQCLFLPLPPPLFVTKTTSSLSGPQASTVQCSQGECVRPATNVISRLQDNLHPALGNITGTVEQQVTSIPSQSPRLQGADSKSSCASSPAVRRIKLVDRQFSNCSNKTLTGTSSPRSSTSSSSELYFTPQSSPLLIPHKGHHVPSKPITCTEASLNEHKPLNNEWQIHSSTLSQRSETYDHHGQGVNCFLASEEATCSVDSQPIARDILCRKICRLDQGQDDPIPFQNELVFSNGPTLKLSLQPRDAEDYCGLVVKVTTSTEHWKNSQSTIDIELCVTVSGNCDQVNKRSCNIVRSKNCNVVIERCSCDSPPQVITLSDVVPHRIITHDMADSSLLFTVTAKKISKLIRINETSGGFVNIDVV